MGRLNHVAIAVPNLAEAAAKYRDVLGVKVGRWWQVLALGGAGSWSAGSAALAPHAANPAVAGCCN